MRPDDFTATEADAAQYARDLGQHEAIGGDGDQEADALLDETGLCSICEHGHHGHVCRWCIGLGRAS